MDEIGEISAGSEVVTSKEMVKSLRPYKEVVKEFGERLSWHRLRRLLNTKKVEGEKRYIQSVRGYPWRWFTTVEAVAKYLASLKTPSEYGKMKPKEGKKERGRPKGKIGKEGVVFQAA